jgi:hypothetical protein
MAQVKVYGRREVLVPNRAKWSELIHGALVAALKLPPDKRFQRFFPLDAEDFVHPADRSPALQSSGSPSSKGVPPKP